MTQAITKEDEKIVTTSQKVYFSDILQEIQGIPQEYWSNLLQILRSFREVTNKNTKHSVHNLTSETENDNTSEKVNTNEGALELLRRWREEDDVEDQKETWEILSKAFDMNE